MDERIASGASSGSSPAPRLGFWNGRARRPANAPMIRRVAIETLAPTGEGISRTSDGVGFIAGALPGEEVEAEVAEVRKRFWKGRAAAILARSPLRLSGAHAEGCAGCDWSYLDLAAARDWKRALFLDTMQRIGDLPAAPFGDLPVAASGAGYRLRSRFHASGRGGSAVLGFHAPRTHRIERADGCEALSPQMRARLRRMQEAVAASGARLREIAAIESIDAAHGLARATLEEGADRREAGELLGALEPLWDGVVVVDASGAVVARSGAARLAIQVGGREFRLMAGTFFQGNRHLVAALADEVRLEAGRIPPGRALDAFGGIGLFAGALADAGHAAVTVESDGGAVELALESRKRWAEAGWEIVRSSVLAFVAGGSERFDVVVVDPPRAGLGLKLCRELPRRVGRVLIYVSCEPATLARDIAALRSGGLEVRRARLFDLFPFTHRVEAVVTLERAAGV